MGSESNNNHSDNLWSSISGFINLRTPLVVWLRHPLVLLSCQLVVESPVVELPSHCAAISSSCLASHYPLIALLSHRLITQVGCCCIASRRAAVLSSRRAPLSSSCCPLTAPPSHHLIVQAGCCVASRRAVVSSSRRPPLTAPPSCFLIAQAGCCVASRCTAVSSSRRADVLSSHRPLTAPSSCRLIVQVVASPLTVLPSRLLSLRRTLVFLSPSHCTTLSSSHRAVWLLCCFSSRRRLVLSSSSYCTTISSSCAGWLLCCLSLHGPLVLSSRCPLVLSLHAS
jgi:hypothetical protein